MNCSESEVCRIDRTPRRSERIRIAAIRWWIGAPIVCALSIGRLSERPSRNIRIRLILRYALIRVRTDWRWTHRSDVSLHGVGRIPDLQTLDGTCDSLANRWDSEEYGEAAYAERVAIFAYNFCRNSHRSSQWSVFPGINKRRFHINIFRRKSICNYYLMTLQTLRIVKALSTFGARKSLVHDIMLVQLVRIVERPIAIATEQHIL